VRRPCPRPEPGHAPLVTGRRLGSLTIACLWIAAWIGGAAVVGTSARVYEYGVTGVWYVIAQAIGCVLFGLFGLFVAARIKTLGDRHRHLTYPDFIEQHYDSRTRIVATATTVLAFTAYSAGQLAASAAILQVMLGWDYELALLVAGTIVIRYTSVGGYLAVTYTDWVQVALLLFGIVVVGIPVAISAAGGWGDLRAALPDTYYDLGAQGWDRIAALVVSMVLAFFVGMDSFSRCFAARDARAARNGALIAAVLILPLAVAAVWLGLAAAVLYPDHATVGSSVLATFVMDAFPPGLKGLMLIAVLSAIMSTADICILTASANYTRDIIDILQLGFTINAAGLFLPTIAALYGSRVPAGAAFWSIGASLVTVIAWRIAADTGAGGLFTLDPLWPGLAVSAVLLVALTLASRERPARASA